MSNPVLEYETRRAWCGRHGVIGNVVAVRGGDVWCGQCAAEALQRLFVNDLNCCRALAKNPNEK